MQKGILRDIQFVEKILQMTCDTLIVLDNNNICLDALVKTDNPVLNPRLQLIGKDFLSLFPYETAKIIGQELEFCRLTGQESNNNYDLPTSEQMYYFKFIIQKFDDGRLLCQYRDITRRSNMKRRLKAALTTLLEVEKEARIGHWTYNTATQQMMYSGFLNVNRKDVLDPVFLRLEEFLEIVHPDDKRKVYNFFFIDKHERQVVEYRISVPGEKIKYVVSTKYSRHLENDEWLISGFSQNVTDLIQNRIELEMILSVVFNAPYSIHANHLDGTLVFANKECRFQNHIPNSQRIFTLPISDVLKNFSSEEQWEEIIHELKERKGFYKYRCDYAYPERNIFSSECRSFLVKNGAGDEIVWTIRRDISDQLRYEEQLMKAKEAAEESEQLKSAFISNMSHEIRTPLNAIVGFSTIIANTEDAELRQEYGQIVSSNSDQLLRLVQDVLEMSHLESGKLQFHTESISLHGILRELEKSFNQPIARPNLYFHLLEDDKPVCLDRGRLLQVLTNLISNAIKFTPDTGEIHVGYTISSESLILSVTDTGIGISPDKLEDIFTRFWKANSVAQGTGLGLAISKSIIEQMNGRIVVQSEEGKGSIFKVYIPLSDVK